MRDARTPHGVGLVVGVLAVTLAATGQAAAQARPTATADTISALAGGVGGPDLATNVELYSSDGPFGPEGVCGVSYNSGHVYVANAGAIREINQGNDWLTTPVGTGFASPDGTLVNGGLATDAYLYGACGAVRDQSGNLVLADTGDNMVRVVAAKAGTFYGQVMKAHRIYDVAGDGGNGYSGDGGPATQAELLAPQSVTVDPAGNLVISDRGNDRVRVVAEKTATFYGQAMTAGDIYTVAGNGNQSFSGDGGPATQAGIHGPDKVVFDSHGNMVIADTYDNRIRVVAATTATFYGQAMKAGDIYSVAGNGTAGFSGDAGPATRARLNNPFGVAVDAAGNLVIADTANSRIRVVATTTATFYGQAMTAGDIYSVAGRTAGFSGDGGRATAAQLRSPQDVTLDGAGNLVIADTGNDRVRVVAETTATFYQQAMKSGHIYTVAGNGLNYSGNGGLATGAEFAGPDAAVTDQAGDLLIADSNAEQIQMVPAASGTYFGQAMTAGHVYTVAGTGTQGFGGDGGPATAAELFDPEGLAVDGAGNLLIADTGNQRIRVVAAASKTFYGQAMTVGDIYTVAGSTSLPGFGGDGGPATSAAFSDPRAVSVDSHGNLIITDSTNDRIRMVAEQTATFYGQAMTTGDVYTVAGGGSGGSGSGIPATSARLTDPYGASTDSAGDLLIADTGDLEVRLVAASTGTIFGQAMTADDIYTVAGGGTTFLGNGGPAKQAVLQGPDTVTVDGAGNLVIADTQDNQIRVVPPKAGTYYGQTMKARYIYDVAGQGSAGFAGNGGPAPSALLSAPNGVSLNSAGDLIISDTGNGRIRLVNG